MVKGWIIIIIYNKPFELQIYNDWVYLDYKEAQRIATEINYADYCDNVILQAVELGEVCDGCPALKAINTISEVVTNVSI